MRAVMFVIGLAFCGFSQNLLADDPAKADESPVLERVLKHLDKDGDGKFSDEERATGQQFAQQLLGRLGDQEGGARPAFGEGLRRFDKDGDGKLSDDEKAAMKDREAQFKRGPFGNFDPNNPPDFVLKRFDKDGDGKLSDSEKADARKAAQEMKGRGPGPGNFQEMMKRFDKDGDGKLNEEEAVAARQAFARMGGPGAPPSREEIIKRFDKDGDGRLNDEEQAAVKAEFDRRRGGGGAGGLIPGEGKGKEPKLNKDELLKQYDKDGDGKLNDEEKAAARDALLKKE